MKQFRVTIKRRNETELNKAIVDLEMRCFTLLKRGTTSREVKDFIYRQSSKTPKTFVGSTTFTGVWAILERG